MNRILLSAILSVLFLPMAARAATPAAGVPQEIRRGFFADVNMGGFFTLGGKNDQGSSAPSNAQPYLQLGVGYDIAKNFALGFSFGIGSSAASCFSMNDKGVCEAADESGKLQPIAENFTATMFALEASYKHYFSERLTLQPRLHLGYASFSPEPMRDSNGAPITGGVIIGAGAGIEYATRMDHFSIGADVFGRYITGPNIFSMAIYPKIKYTF